MHDETIIPADRAAEIVTFWFGESCAAAPSDFADRLHLPDKSVRELWFAGDEAMDRRVTERFGGDVERELERRDAHAVAEGEVVRHSLRLTLARILLLDQFTRNVFRGEARAFAGDALARALVLAVADLVRRRPERAGELRLIELAFVYMPLMHAEDLRMQERGEELFGELAATARQAPGENQALIDSLTSFADFAQKHANVIRRFGRFPHRNAALGRESLPEEEQFLDADGRGF